MANQEHLDIIKQGIQVWNRWREREPDIIPDLRGVDLTRIVLSEADLRWADLRWADLRWAKLRWAKLGEAFLNGVHLNGADLTGADLHLADLERADLEGADLSGAHLDGATLSRATLGGATLRGAGLFRANLRGVDLARAHLEGADLHWADLGGADLRWANLSEASLSQTDLSGALFLAADLRGVDLREAKLSNTSFSGVDLSHVSGLDAVQHFGPCSIGIDTLYRSGGNIPESFLRGCGVPDQFIEYARTLVGKAIEYYSCFISYSSKDEECAQRLHADLQANNVRCWFAPHDMKIGARIRPAIDDAIRLHDKLLLILSEISVASQWVEQEVERALQKERDNPGSTVLFPIRLDDAVMEMAGGWPNYLRNTRNIGDFTRWKNHDAYQQAFQRLLRDLKAAN